MIQRSSWILLCAMLWSGFSVGDILPRAESKRVPDLVGVLLTGGDFDLKQYRGSVVVVNFWATWCAPCVDEMPALEFLWRKVKDKGVVVVGVNMGESQPAVSSFLVKVPASFPIVLDNSAEITSAWGIGALPATYILNAKGEAIYAVLGKRPWDSSAIVREILSLRPAS